MAAREVPKKGSCMQSGHTEIESFIVYPSAEAETYRVDAMLIDLANGDRRAIRDMPVSRTAGANTWQIVPEPPWDAMPQPEREFFASQLAQASAATGGSLSEPGRPAQLLSLPRVRYLVPEVGSPGQDKEIENPSPPFVPPFESNWERLFDGDVAEPVTDQNVFVGMEMDVVRTVTSLGTGLKVLDAGCAAGLTGEAAKRIDPEIEWVGIDNVPAAVDEAQRRLDAARLVDIERDALPFEPGCFDVAVLSQLLEHLWNPWAAARKVAACLKDGGIMLCSVPHGGHVAVLAQLIEGRYPYSRSGPLDISHLRTFTAETLLQLVERAGCQPAVLTKSLFRMTRYDERLMAGLMDAGRQAGLDCDAYSTDGWAVGFTVLARKQRVTVARRSSLLRRAEKRHESGDVGEAHRLLTLETTLRPENALGFIRLAEILDGQGQVDEAVVALEQCVNLHESYLPARYELIRALHKTGRTNEAISALEEAAALNPKFFIPLQTLFM